MPKIQELNFSTKSKKKLKFILYFLFLFFFCFIVYFNIPKLLNFSTDSIKKNLKNNNDININNISKVVYKIFPTPRLSIQNSDFTIGDEIFEVSNSELEIILNISKILNYKEINYKKLLIHKGSSKIDLNNINYLLASLNENKKQLTIKKNNLIFLKKDKFFLEINNSLIKTHKLREKKILIIDGNFLNNKIVIKLENTPKNKNNLTLKIPELDISSRTFFKKNNSSNISGFFNLEIFNNLLKVNFIKGDNIKLVNSFIRSKMVNTSLKGEITFKPNFYIRLDFEPSSFNMEKLYPIIQKNYFSDNNNNLPLIKKINGILNFKSKFDGRIKTKNGEVIFENFKVGKNKSLYFNARVSEFGKKGKINFNLIKTIQYKKDLTKKIKIIGFLIPSSSAVVFENFLIDDKRLSIEKTKEYENKFKEDLVLDSLGNIFNENNIDKFFKDLF